MRSSTGIAAALALLAASAARAGTIEVNSTTLLNVARQTRGGSPGQTPDLVTTAPAFEILNITARDLASSVANDLTIVLSTWGSYELNDRRWDNGTTGDLTGDVRTGYLQGKLLDRRLTLRVGRAQVQTGVARMIHLDGGEAIAILPFGLRLSAYAGVPVSQRFTTRTGPRNWNPLGGDLAYGGRVGWTVARPGIAGRGLDVGASVNMVEDNGDPVRQEVGADLRLRPVDRVVLTAFGAYSLYDERFSEATFRAGFTPVRRLLVEADYRFIAPDLLLSRNSILSVFSAEERHEPGLGFSYRLAKGLGFGASYHALLEPGEKAKAREYVGSEADARVDWERGHTMAGLEAFFLDSFENGYVGGRAFGRQDFGRAFATADVLLHVFREDVNGESSAVTGEVSLGYQILNSLSAVIAGRAGMTPFLERSFDVMAKLAYGQTYIKSEVR
jgi:hypothetical protein